MRVSGPNYDMEHDIIQGQIKEINSLDDGDFTISETLPAGYEFDKFEGANEISYAVGEVTISDDGYEHHIKIYNDVIPDPPETYSIVVEKEVTVVNGTPSGNDTFGVQVTNGQSVVDNGGPQNIADGESFEVTGLLEGTYYVEELVGLLPPYYVFTGFGGDADTNGMVTLPNGDSGNATVIVKNSYNEPDEPTYTITIEKFVEVLSGTPSQNDTFDVQVTDGQNVIPGGGPQAISNNQTFVINGLVAGTYYVEELLGSLPDNYSFGGYGGDANPQGKLCCRSMMMTKCICNSYQ